MTAAEAAYSGRGAVRTVLDFGTECDGVRSAAWRSCMVGRRVQGPALRSVCGELAVAAMALTGTVLRLTLQPPLSSLSHGGFLLSVREVCHIGMSDDP